MKNDIKHIATPINAVVHSVREAGINGALLAHLETYVAITLEVLKNVHPKHLREAARFVEIQGRMKGAEVSLGEAKQTRAMQEAIDFLKEYEVQNRAGVKGVEVGDKFITSEDLVEALERVRDAQMGEAA